MVQIAGRILEEAGYSTHLDEGGIKVQDDFIIVRSSFMWVKIVENSSKSEIQNSTTCFA